MSVNEAQIRLGWREGAWVLGILLAIGAAYTDLRMSMTRIETQQVTLMLRMDRLERQVDAGR